MHENEKIKRLIDLYLSGKANEEEEQQLNEWFSQLHAAPEAGYKPLLPEERQQLGERMYQRIQEDLRPHTVVVGPERSVRRLWWKVAAAVIPLAVLSAALLFSKWNTARKTTAEEPMLDLYTQKGQLSKITLADNTVIWLNGNSHLRYPQQFTGSNRKVYLEGEAYFEVQQDPVHPFIIESGGYRTQVLGTAFNIRSYPTPHIYKVTVTSGKVAVYRHSDSTSAILLTADQQVMIDCDEHTQQVRQVHATELLAWRKGGVSFEKDPLMEVVAAMESRYGVVFRFENTILKKKEISGVFDNGQSLDDILKILSRVYSLHFKRQSNGIIAIS
ncbi:MAG TPA: FecR domain-containing protein [Chitinophaga sp.]|uniref:FecR family protein n=1 Tax=Chitinophaga sp. TaxID=1869181 RepID=UPI002C6F46E6|nr:FecR domain-containing protein [Chitinophaga sp.]HVI44044.1 FecR domain-containing protein [Chitinophaga sp.]